MNYARVKKLVAALLLALFVTPAISQAILKDINIGQGGCDASGFVQFNNLTCFIANDGIHGYELWITDGTEGGTRMVKDINPGPADGCRYMTLLSIKTSVLQPLGKFLYFFADDGKHGYELWKSDGTEEGTMLVKDILTGPISSNTDMNVVLVNKKLVFAATDGLHGLELWSSTGIDSETVMVRDINPGRQDATPQSFFVDSNVVYFSANDGKNGFGLWKTNGTDSGTTFLKTVAPTANNTGVPYVKCKEQLFFAGYTLTNGVELWKTNGTTEGTTLVKDIDPGAVSGGPQWLTVLNDRIAFTADQHDYGRELWQSDGTESGTGLVKDIYKGTLSSFPANLVSFNGKLFFTARDSVNRVEWWVSDLSDTGTHLFLNMFFVAGDSTMPGSFCNLGNSLCFCGSSTASGCELWQTDGTMQGTKMAKDLCFGSCSSSPACFFKSDKSVFFIASDEEHGREIWKLGGAPSLLDQINEARAIGIYRDPLIKQLSQLAATGDEIKYIKVFDLGGNEILTQYVQSPGQLSADTFTKGIYLIRAYDKNDIAIGFTRFVKD